MKKQFTLAILYSTLISLVVSTALVALIIGKSRNNVQHACDMSGIAFGIAWFFILTMAIGSCGIYLNGFQKVRENGYYAALSFFLLPVLISVLFVTLMDDFNTEWPIYSVIILPYLFIWVFHFLRFRRKFD